MRGGAPRNSAAAGAAVGERGEELELTSAASPSDMCGYPHPRLRGSTPQTTALVPRVSFPGKWGAVCSVGARGGASMGFRKGRGKERVLSTTATSPLGTRRSWEVACLLLKG